MTGIGAATAAALMLAGCASTSQPPPMPPSDTLATAPTPAAPTPAAPISPIVPLAPTTPTPSTSPAPAAATPAAPGAPSASPSTTAATQAYHGRFALQYSDRYGNRRNVYGNFDWQEHGDDVSLELRGPLGQTVAIVRASPNGATLELPNREPKVAPDVDELMQNTLGFSLPLAGLRYWLVPTPAPATPATTVRDPGDATHIKEIRQDGWTIDYVAYADAPATGVRRVNIVRDTPPLDIKLVLDQ